MLLQVTTLHSDMIRWMVQVLLRLAPDKKGNSKEAGEMALLGSATFNELHQNAKSLFEQLQMFSIYVVQYVLYHYFSFVLHVREADS